MRKPTLLIAALVGIVLPAVLPAQRPAYPASARNFVVEDLFGHRVADPYRWLEALDRPATKTDRIIAEIADEYAFALANLGMTAP